MKLDLPAGVDVEIKAFGKEHKQLSAISSSHQARTGRNGNVELKSRQLKADSYVDWHHRQKSRHDAGVRAGRQRRPRHRIKAGPCVVVQAKTAAEGRV